MRYLPVLLLSASGVWAQVVTNPLPQQIQQRGTCPPPVTFCDAASDVGNEYVCTGGAAQIYLCANVGDGGGSGIAGTGGGNPAFSAVTAGTNTTAAMVVGGTSTLTSTGTTAFIEANKLRSYSGSCVANKVGLQSSGALFKGCTPTNSTFYLATADSNGFASFSLDGSHTALADEALVSDDVGCVGCIDDSEVDNNITASNYCPLGGCTYSGVVITEDSDVSAIFPTTSAATSQTSIEWKSKGDFINASWYTGNFSRASGTGSENHVFSIGYNWLNNNRMVSGEHAWNMQLESGYWGLDAEANEQLEWSINIDPNLDAAGPLGATLRLWDWKFQRTTHDMTWQVGLKDDPAVQFWSLNQEGYVYAGKGTGNAVFQDKTVAAIRDPANTNPYGYFSQARVMLAPGGNFNVGSERAVVIQNTFGLGYMDLESGLGPGGEAREIYISRERNDNVVFGTPGPTGRVNIYGNEDEIQFYAKGHSTQSNFLVLVEKSDGSDLLTVANSGNVAASGTLSGSNLSGTNTGDEIAGVGFSISSHIISHNYTFSLAGNPAMNAKECVFTTSGTSGGGFICEGDTGSNGNEQLHLFAAQDGADTTDFIATHAAAVTDLAGAGLTVSAGVQAVATTEIGTNTWGSGSAITWTFDAGSTDPAVAFTSGNVDFSTTVTGTSFTADDPGDGSRGITLSDNTSEPSAPADTTPDSTLLYTLGGEVYKKDEGDSTNERLLLTSGNLSGDVTATSTGVASIPTTVINTGTYTPTLTNVANLAASTAYQCQWMRIRDIVTVSCKVDVDPTLAATATQLGISLPVASALAAQEDCAGTAFASGIASQGAAIRGDATNDRAEMVWVSGDITNQPMYLTFTYQVL